jgi:hypothetical protein
MTMTITQAFVQQWDSAIRLQAQQKESRLARLVTDRGTITGESFTANMLAPAEDTPANTTRHGDTIFSDIIHSTRVGLMQDFFQALPVDRNDEPKLLANPNGSYQESLVAAWNRRKDRVIYNALIGPAQLKDGSTVAVPAGQTVLPAATGMTKAKILTARKLFRKNEADEHNGDELYMLYNSEMLEDILADATLTTVDQVTVKAFQEGDINRKWAGFTWVPYEQLSLSGGTYTTVAFTKSSCHYGTGFVEGSAGRRKDKKNLMQVDMAGSVGAVRVEENKVVLVQFV